MLIIIRIIFDLLGPPGEPGGSWGALCLGLVRPPLVTINQLKRRLSEKSPNKHLHKSAKTSTERKITKKYQSFNEFNWYPMSHLIISDYFWFCLSSTDTLWTIWLFLIIIWVQLIPYESSDYSWLLSEFNWYPMSHLIIPDYYLSSTDTLWVIWLLCEYQWIPMNTN